MPQYDIDNPPEPDDVGESLSSADIGIIRYGGRFVQSQDNCGTIAVKVAGMFGLDLDIGSIREKVDLVNLCNMPKIYRGDMRIPEPAGKARLVVCDGDRFMKHVYLRVGEKDYNFGVGASNGYQEQAVLGLSPLE